MTSVVWENLLLALPFVLAIVGIPLWMVNRRPDRASPPVPVAVPVRTGRPERQPADSERVLVRT